jgi:hypothetical protein
VFEANSALWGGLFNFIIPLFKQVPARYREKYFNSGANRALAILLRGSLASLSKGRKQGLHRPRQLAYIPTHAQIIMA